MKTFHKDKEQSQVSTVQLARSLQPEKVTKGTQIGEKWFTVYLFSDGITPRADIQFEQNTKLTDKYSKNTYTKINHRNTIPFTIHSHTHAHTPHKHTHKKYLKINPASGSTIIWSLQKFQKSTLMKIQHLQQMFLANMDFNMKKKMKRYASLPLCTNSTANGLRTST